MGAVYDVTLKLKYSSEQDVIDATEHFVKVNSGKVKFSDVDYSSIETAIQIILPKRGFHINSQTDNSIDCDCGFDASYGWESVMYDWFAAIAVTLNNGSSIDVYPDSGHTIGTIQNGEVVWNDGDDDEDWDEDEDEWDEDDEGEDDEDEDGGSAMQVDDPELQKAIDYINEFTEDEYGDTAITDGTDLSDVGLMFTFAGDEDEYTTEVSADLVNYTISYFVNGELVDQDKFSSISEMNDTLKILSFDWLYHACCRQIDWDEDEE